MSLIGKKLCAMTACATMLIVTGCKSYWINATVENHTGQPVHELEVDYPTASFGVNLLTPETPMHYRFQIRGSGAVKVEYTSSDGKTSHAQGLILKEHQHGDLVIRLLPAGKVEFSPALQPAS